MAQLKSDSFATEWDTYTGGYNVRAVATWAETTDATLASQNKTVITTTITIELNNNNSRTISWVEYS